MPNFDRVIYGGVEKIAIYEIRGGEFHGWKSRRLEDKFEYRNPKSETISKMQCSKFKANR
jgi:hypothetical protein